MPLTAEDLQHIKPLQQDVETIRNGLKNVKLLLENKQMKLSIDDIRNRIKDQQSALKELKQKVTATENEILLRGANPSDIDEEPSLEKVKQDMQALQLLAAQYLHAKPAAVEAAAVPAVAAVGAEHGIDEYGSDEKENAETANQRMSFLEQALRSQKDLRQKMQSIPEEKIRAAIDNIKAQFDAFKKGFELAEDQDLFDTTLDKFQLLKDRIKKFEQDLKAAVPQGAAAPDSKKGPRRGA